MALGALGAGLIGGGISALGSILGSNEQADAAREAARMSAFRPTNVTSGFGSVNATITGRDPYGNPIYSYNTAIDPRYAAMRDQLFGMGQGFLGQAQTYDPAQAGALFTQQLREQSAPTEQAQRTALENRLFQQGLMGATVGAERFGALQEAQRRADVQREMVGREMAQQEQQGLFSRGLQGIQAGTAIEALPDQLMNQSIAASGGQTAAAGRGAQFNFEAGMNRGNAIAGFFGSLGQGLMNYSYGGGGGWQMPGTYSSPGGGTAGGFSWGNQAPIPGPYSMFGR